MALQHHASSSPIILTEDERAALETLSAHRSGRSFQARRARIILMTADGHSAADICRILGCAGQTVTSWRRRFLKVRMVSLHNAMPARGRSTR